MHMENLNQLLFMLINASYHPSPVVLAIAMFAAQWLIYALPVLLVWMWTMGGRAERKAAVSATVAVGVALLVGQIITIAWPHPRPFMIGLGHTLMAHQPEASFPSDHATVFFTLALGLLIAGMRKVGVTLLLAGALVGWSRVFLGVHFPFDIAGALIVAGPCAWIVSKVFDAPVGGRLVGSLEQTYELFLKTARR